MSDKGDLALAGWRGKMASNDRIEENCNRLVELDKAYWKLVASRDRGGLLELASQAQQANQHSIAKRAKTTALELQA